MVVAPVSSHSATLSMFTGPAGGVIPPAGAPAGSVFTAADLAGDWAAGGPGKTSFRLALAADGAFTWPFTHEDRTEESRGVFAVDRDTLALKPDSGGTLAATLTKLGADSFTFAPIGAPPGKDPLTFTRTPTRTP